MPGWDVNVFNQYMIQTSFIVFVKGCFFYCIWYCFCDWLPEVPNRATRFKLHLLARIVCFHPIVSPYIIS